MIQNFFRNIARIASAMVIFLTFMAYLCPQVNPEIFPWLSFFGTAFPWLLLANLLFCLFWIWRRNRFAFYHIAILVVGWTYVSSFMGFNMSGDAVPEDAITIATHNLGGIFAGYKRVSNEIREKKAVAYADFLKENGFPDILCTQETGPRFTDLLAKKMDYPYTFKLKKSTVIFSRYPLEAGGEIPFTQTQNSATWVDLRINDRLVRVYAVHLQSNRVTSATEKVIDEAEFADENTWDDIQSILGKVGRATQLRAEQAKLVQEHMAACPHRIILCGDFNDTPNSYVFSMLSERLTDTFREKGTGLGSTFAGALPFLRIDYVLVSPKFKVYACRRVKGEFSDHYPVFADIGF